MLLIGNGMMVTRDPANPYFADGCVAVEGKLIAEVGTTADLKAKYAGKPGVKFVDAKGGLIMPGFINAHMHYYSAFSRGIFTKDAPAQDFFAAESVDWALTRASNSFWIERYHLIM